MGHLLSTSPVDEQSLIELKNQLLLDVYQPEPIRHPLMMEKEMYLLEISRMTPKRYEKLFADFGKHQNGDRLLELLEKNDPTILERSATYLEKYYDRVFAAIEKPYPASSLEIGAVSEKTEEAAQKNDAAILTAIFSTAVDRVYTLAVNWKTHYNATLTALDVYIVAAKTGKFSTVSHGMTIFCDRQARPFHF